MADGVAVDETEAGHRVILGALEQAESRVVARGVLGTRGGGRTAAAELSVELLSERLAEQVESEGVHARVGEGQDTRTDAGDEMGHGGVHLCVVVGAVKVNHMVGEPGDGKKAHEHQHGFGETHA